MKRPRLIAIRNPNAWFKTAIRKPNHPKSEHQNVRNWDGVRFSKFSFRAPTVPYASEYQTSRSQQVVIAKWLARLLATKGVPGSNPGKGEND